MQDYAIAFTHWIRHGVTNHDIEGLLDYRERAPHAVRAHPTEEHFLPLLVALALLAWVAGVLESSNLWDYLIDPWLATAALFQCVKVAAASWRTWLSRWGPAFS